MWQQFLSRGELEVLAVSIVLAQIVVMILIGATVWRGHKTISGLAFITAGVLLLIVAYWLVSGA